MPRHTHGRCDKVTSMKKIFVYFLLSVLFLLPGCSSKEQLTTFILVRHAEKANDGTEDPPLNADGEARAKRLAYILKDTPLEAIYTTHFRRTRDTVRPIAETQNVQVQLYEAFKPELILRMVEQHKGGTVLVAGHSNNIPWTANLLLGRDVFEDYEESEYGVMLIVSVGRTNNLSSVTRLNY